MPILIFAGLAALVLLVIVAQRKGWLTRRPCNWKRDPTRTLGAQTRYVCTACGVDAYSTGGPPRLCKRHLRGGL